MAKEIKMSKRVYIIIILLIPIFCIFLFGQRGIKVVVKTSEGSSLELYNQYRALIIGVSDYLYWPRLPNAVKDARDVAAILRERGFITRVLENPDSEEMKGALDRLVFSDSGARDGVLIYFAGHGETMKLADNTELGYIIPKDCPLQSKDSIGFSRKAISMEDIQTYSLQLKSKHLLAIFDSCFSGSIFALGRAAPADITHKTTQPVRQYITAGGGDEVVPDESIFKRCFLDALKGEADANNDGYVTGSELGMYLESKVVNYSRNAQHPQYGKIRNPNLDKGDFVFVLDKVKISEAEEAQLPPEPPETSNIDISSIKKTAEERERIKEPTELKVKVQAGVSLRSSAQSLSWDEGKSMVKRKNFFDSKWNNSEGFENEYESKTINGDKVVLDHATGLTWHQFGSERLRYDKAKQWADELNRRGYAGYSDWRLPTLEEGASLIERNKMNGDLYIDAKFSAKQRWILTSDTITDYSGRVWVARFDVGIVGWSTVDSSFYVRPVRSGR